MLEMVEHAAAAASMLHPMRLRILDALREPDSASGVARQLGLDAPGYRLLSNMGQHAGQEVPHLHVHLFGGQPLGAMLVRGG